MHQAKNLTWKQERFVSEYLLSRNAAEALRKSGYQTRYPSEIGYGLKRHPKVRSALIEAQEARARRLEIQADLVASKYVELMERALEAKDFETALQALNQLCQRLRIFERHQALPLLEIMEQDPDNLEELVDQFLWINTSLGNWSYVLRALELKVKLAGKEKGELNYEEMLNSLELVA